MFKLLLNVKNFPKRLYKILIICFVFISFKPSESVRKQKLDTGLLAIAYALQEGVP